MRGLRGVLKLIFESKAESFLLLFWAFLLFADLSPVLPNKERIREEPSREPDSSTQRGKKERTIETKETQIRKITKKDKNDTPLLESLELVRELLPAGFAFGMYGGVYVSRCLHWSSEAPSEFLVPSNELNTVSMLALLQSAVVVCVSLVL